ncbi:MAG: LysM peptidoglycan-binding domain-containing protein [Akkermansiaceae bacterium]
MKKTIQTKRSSSNGSSYRVLYAKTGRKRRLNAATATLSAPPAELESDVPNVGVGRALLVILVLHVVAIAAIYLHSKFVSGDAENVAQPENAPVAAVTAPSPTTPPAPKPEPPRPAPVAPVVAPEVNDPAPAPAAVGRASNRHYVTTGESYPSIARTCNVDERALRALNDNRPLRAGVVLNLPDRLSSRPVAVRQTPERVAPQPVVEAPKPTPPAPRQYPRAVEVDEQPAAPVVVKPRIQRPVEADTGVADSGKRYTVKKGDTVWRISTRYKVSRETLLKLNGITDPRKLYIGREIKIPSK